MSACYWCGRPTINALGCDIGRDGRDCYRQSELNTLPMAPIVAYPPPPGWRPPLHHLLVKRSKLSGVGGTVPATTVKANTCFWCGADTNNKFGCSTPYDGRDCYLSTELVAAGYGGAQEVSYPPPPNWTPPLRNFLAARMSTPQGSSTAHIPGATTIKLNNPIIAGKSVFVTDIKKMTPAAPKIDPFAPVGLRESRARPKDPKLPCCGWCGEALGMIYNQRTGVKRGCSVHGLDVPVVGEFAGSKRHP